MSTIRSICRVPGVTSKRLTRALIVTLALASTTTNCGSRPSWADAEASPDVATTVAKVQPTATLTVTSSSFTVDVKTVDATGTINIWVNGGQLPDEQFAGPFHKTFTSIACEASLKVYVYPTGFRPIYLQGSTSTCPTVTTSSSTPSSTAPTSAPPTSSSSIAPSTTSSLADSPTTASSTDSTPPTDATSTAPTSTTDDGIYYGSVAGPPPAAGADEPISAPVTQVPTLPATGGPIWPFVTGGLAALALGAILVATSKRPVRITNAPVPNGNLRPTSTRHHADAGHHPPTGKHSGGRERSELWHGTSRIVDPAARRKANKRLNRIRLADARDHTMAVRAYNRTLAAIDEGVAS